MISRRSILALIGLAPAVATAAKALASDVDLEKQRLSPSERYESDVVQVLKVYGDANTTAMMVAVPPSRRTNPEQRIYTVTVNGIYVSHRDSTLMPALPDFQWWWGTPENPGVYRPMLIVVPTVLASPSRVPVVEVQ